MELKHAIQGDLRGYLRQELRLAGGANRTAAKRASTGLHNEAYRQLRRAGIKEFKRGKSEWWRKAVVDTRPDYGLDTKGIVFSGFSKAALAFEEGAVLRSKNGRWLAIPAEGLGDVRNRLSSGGLLSSRRRNFSRIGARSLGTPGGRKAAGGHLQFLPTRNANVAMLVLKRPGQPDQVVYWLYRQLRITKRISFYQAAEKWGDKYPQYLVSEWERRATRLGVR